MSEQQLAALLEQLKQDQELLAKLRNAADLDAALAVAVQAGFEVSRDDWLQHRQNQAAELSDEELESMAAGKYTGCTVGCTDYMSLY